MSGTQQKIQRPKKFVHFWRKRKRVSEDPPTFDAALIAGGKSSRFGEDKAFLDWKGQPLYVHQLRKLAQLNPGKIFLSTNADQDFPAVLEGVERVVDCQPGLGPIGALQSIFKASSAKFVLTLAVDLPLMEVSFLRQLLEKNSGSVPETGRHTEPLVALYPRREMLELIETAISEENLKLQSLVRTAVEAGLVKTFPVEESELGNFSNVNSPADLDSIQQGQFDEATLLDRYRVDSGFDSAVTDRVAAEEPLEVRVNGKSVSVMMRTPGHDDELVAGFLFTERIITGGDEIQEIAHCPDVDPEGVGNTLDVRLAIEPDFDALTRHVFTSSSCGVCGKATIESVFQNFPPLERSLKVEPEIILSLPGKLRAAQETFDKTGGLHASALFSAQGEMLLLREDVGRHNALDKVIGHAVTHEMDLSKVILLVSGRVSFELMQKALAARIPVVAGISAPSSLAVKLAKESGQTLIGFLRQKGFNRYHCSEQ